MNVSLGVKSLLLSSIQNFMTILSKILIYTRKKRQEGKGSVHPRTYHAGPEGEHKYSSTRSLTSALDRSGLLTPRPDRFSPGK